MFSLYQFFMVSYRKRLIKYLLEELPQLENINDEKVLEKYLPWSKEIPKEISNYEGEYKELTLS